MAALDADARHAQGADVGQAVQLLVCPALVACDHARLVRKGAHHLGECLRQRGGCGEWAEAIARNTGLATAMDAFAHDSSVDSQRASSVSANAGRAFACGTRSFTNASANTAPASCRNMWPPWKAR